MNQDTSQRIDREREFHNDRFAVEVRLAQQKFYSSLRNCFGKYQRDLEELSTGQNVLEYGCAKGERSLELSARAKEISGIDISSVAIDAAIRSSRKRSIGNATFTVMNAEDMTFEDNTFDLVFGSGIIHHLNVEKSFSEIARVLKPGGQALFLEPLGHNPLINWYRDRTPEARTPDEHPMLKSDFKSAESLFSMIDLRTYGLTTIGSSIISNALLRNTIFHLTRPVDRVLLTVPFLKWQAWFALIRLYK